MKRVVIESPFAGRHGPACRCLQCWFDVERNKRYARALARVCLRNGEAPIASHLLYTQEGILDDTIPGDRALGIEAGLVWAKQAEATVTGTSLGVSGGMTAAIRRAQEDGRPVEVRAAEVPTPIEMPTQLTANPMPGNVWIGDDTGGGRVLDPSEAEALALALLWAAKEARR